MINENTILIIIVIIVLICAFCGKDDEDKIEHFSISDKQRVYLDIIRRTKSALGRLNIPFFLSSGTCLGYYREGKFIDYDYDIDIGIFREHYTDKIIEEMKNENLILYRTWGDIDNGLELSFRMPETCIGKHAKIDIFLHYNTDEHTSWYSYSPTKKRLQYRVSKFDIKDVDFMGVTVGVPNPTLKYIEEHYGDDWFIPKRPFTEYRYFSDPVSIIKD